MTAVRSGSVSATRQKPSPALSTPPSTEISILFSRMDDFRDQLRARLAEHHPGPPPKGRVERLAWQRAYCATAVEHDLAGPSWPREYGGMDLTFEQQVIYAEEVARARVPAVPGTGVGIAGPTSSR